MQNFINSRRDSKAIPHFEYSTVITKVPIFGFFSPYAVIFLGLAPHKYICWLILRTIATGDIMLKHWYQNTIPKNGYFPPDQRPKDIPPVKKYDAIVVGAGPAGSCAACFMAREGMDVLLVERAPYPGAKNCGGSSVIADHAHKLFPNFWEEFEYERIVNDQAYWFMTEDSILTTSFRSTKLGAAPYNRLTVRRSNFYKWLADKAVQAGATLLLSHNVSSVLFDGAQAVGVQIAPPQNNYYLADIIVLAEGVNSLLAERAGLIPRISPLNTSLYAQETIAMPSEIIEERFNLLPGYGSTIGLIGYPTAGFNGTGSIHLYKDAISLNVGMAVSDFAKSGLKPNELLDRVKKHPLLQPILAGGQTIEYGGAMIPEGGYNAIPKLVHPGLLITGDAATLVNGVHGYNLAMWSGYYAAKAAYAAKKARDFSAGRLALYRTLLNESFIIQDLKVNAGAASFQRNLPYFFDLYTKMLNEAAYHSAKVYTMPKRARRVFIFKKLISMQPPLKIMSDAWQAFKVMI